MGLETEDVRIFAWECGNIALKKKNQRHREYEKKHKTYTLYETTERLLTRIQNILGENKSNTFQFVVLLFYYLSYPYAKYQNAKQLLDSYRARFEILTTAFDAVMKASELFSDPNTGPIDKGDQAQLDLDEPLEEISFQWHLLSFRIESLELILGQIDESD